jgi:DNA-binding response OmpR family regulator
LTAESVEALRERHAESGITEYFAKPIKPERLFDLIEKVYRSSHSAGMTGTI